MNEKSDLVLVHGAWGGAWIWRRVVEPLRAAGRRVHAVTLTGDGDRAHLRHAGIDLFTHIEDVLAAIATEEPRTLTLVGHSYAGQVITGVADRLLQAGSPQLCQLVYVDAMVPLPGEGWGDTHPPEIVAARRAAASANNNALPPPDGAVFGRVFGLADADRDWLVRRHVPHPFGAYRQALHFDGERWAQVPRCFVDCVKPAYRTIEEARKRVRQQPGWRIVELQTGHFLMVSEPEALTRLLLSMP